MTKDTNALPSPQDPYVVHVDDNAQVDSDWRVGLFGGCSDSCLSCVVPTFVPCVGISESACGFMERPQAILLGVVFGILVLCDYIFCILFATSGKKKEYYYYYDSYYNYLTDTWDYYYTLYYTEKTSYTYFVILWVCILLYVLGLTAFRSVFRSKLTIPGNCGLDLVLSAFCSCCVVAQMRTHTKRGGDMSDDVDTLPPYTGN